MKQTRHSTTAQGTSFNVEPMTDARRQQIHGPLRSLVEEARREGMLPLWAGTLFLAACLAVIIGFILFLEPPARSLAVHAPTEAVTPTTSVVEAGAGNRGQGR